MDPGTVLTHIWCTFDRVVFNVTMGSFIISALVSKWPVYQNRLPIVQNGVNIGIQEH